MNKRFLIVIAFALVVSAAGSVTVYRLIAARVAASAQPAENVVVAAARDLGVGTLIRSTDIRLVPWRATVPPHAIADLKNALDRGVVADIYSGEPVLETRLAAKGAGAGLAATIPEGMRAAAVKVNEVVGISGFAVPGMRVDVLIIGQPYSGAREAGTMSKTLLQNIQVLSAGQQIQKNAEGKPVSVQVVNLLVTAEQAETLSLASNEARIQLVLRNPLDTKEIETKGKVLGHLFGAPVPVQAQRPAARMKPALKRSEAPKEIQEKIEIPFIVEVIHGGKKGAVKTQAKFVEKSEDR